jgi:ubiquinone/menaquinone biosynthesis C-methylase UbiE
MMFIVERAQPAATSRQPGGFDRMAEDYDRWYESPVNRFIDDIERRAVMEALPPAGGKELLLDVGSGTGHWLPVFERRGYEVVSLDLSQAMLAVARKRFGAGPVMVRADALELPFADSRFDVVLSMATLEFTGHHHRVLDEMHRCLKPGGRLLVGVLNALSFLGVRRKLFRSQTYRGAHFFTPWELARCLSRYGQARVTTCAFILPYKIVMPLGGLMERMGRKMLGLTGQFIVGWTTKQIPGPS